MAFTSANMYGNFPFKVEQDPYNCSMRLEYNGFRMAVPNEVWLNALKEPAMMDKLTQEFMLRYSEYARSRYASMQQHPWKSYSEMSSEPTKVAKEPKKSPSYKNKKLLLCEI